MKAVCRTNSVNPSKSLIKRICYPDLFAFTSKQTEWGQKHERFAREEYLKAVKRIHQNLQLTENGLFINPKWPFIGASPDGIIECDCCGKGTVEIKCPYSHRAESIEKAAMSDKQFCLIQQGDSLHLDYSHAYYYQIQAQLFVCDVQHCDFCVFTCPEGKTNIHVERIRKDEEFWEECAKKYEDFFTTYLLPEVLGHWYTRQIVSTVDECQPSSSQLVVDDCDSTEPHPLVSNIDGSQPSSSQLVADDCDVESDVNEVYCYCKGPDEGKMIGCDNNKCAIQWFHLDCLRITSIPKGKWFCPDCRKTTKGKGRKKI